MKEFVEKLIERLGEAFHDVNPYVERVVVKIVNQLAEEYDKRNFYGITLNGCDDDTYFVMAMTEIEHEFLSRVSEKANETSTYGCMPRLYIEEVEMVE